VTVENALHVVLREVCRSGPRGDPVADTTWRVRRPPRRRRAIVGLSWTLVWTLAWFGAILAFAHKIDVAAAAAATPPMRAVGHGFISPPVGAGARVPGRGGRRGTCAVNRPGARRPA